MYIHLLLLCTLLVLYYCFITLVPKKKIVSYFTPPPAKFFQLPRPPIIPNPPIIRYSRVAVVLAKTRICADFTEQVNNIALKLGGFNISYLRIYSKIYTVFKKTFRFDLIFRAFFLHYLFFFIQGNLFLSYFRSIFHFYTPWNLAISNISFQL